MKSALNRILSPWAENEFKCLSNNFKRSFKGLGEDFFSLLLLESCWNSHSLTGLFVFWERKQIQIFSLSSHHFSFKSTFLSNLTFLLLKTALLTVPWRLLTDTQRKAEFIVSPSSFVTYGSNTRPLKKEKKSPNVCLLIMASLVETISKFR